MRNAALEKVATNQHAKEQINAARWNSEQGRWQPLELYTEEETEAAARRQDELNGVSR